MNKYRNNAPLSGAGASAGRIAVQPHTAPDVKINRYGMSQAEYQSYLVGCRETSQLCEDYLAFYIQYANAPLTV